MFGAEVVPGVSIQSEMDMGEGLEQTSSFDVGPGAQPTQPPRAQLGTTFSDMSVSTTISGSIDGGVASSFRVPSL